VQKLTAGAAPAIIRHVDAPLQTEQLTGLDLKVARVRERLKAKDIAAEMDVTPSRVSSIEREQFVTPETAKRYLEAVTTCSTRRTSTPAIA
jgi:DNA-binding transcriptional regulator YiaG